MKLPKYQHKTWKALNREYSWTIQICIVSYIVAFITWFTKGLSVTHAASVWQGYLCGVYTVMVISSYSNEKFYNIDKMKAKIAKFCDEEGQRMITLIEAERIKMDGEEWKR